MLLVVSTKYPPTVSLFRLRRWGGPGGYPSFLDCGGGEAADSAGLAVGFEVGNDVNLEVEIGVDLGVSTVDSGVGADDALWVGDGACAGVGFGVELGLGTISICWRLFRKALATVSRRRTIG